MNKSASSSLRAVRCRISVGEAITQYVETTAAALVFLRIREFAAASANPKEAGLALRFLARRWFARHGVLFGPSGFPVLAVTPPMNTNIVEALGKATRLADQACRHLEQASLLAGELTLVRASEAT